MNKRRLLCGDKLWLQLTHVGEIGPRRSCNDVTVDGISATSLDIHYAAISTYMDYQAPSLKHTSTVYPYLEYL